MGNLLRKPSKKLAAQLKAQDQRICELEEQLQHQSANFSIFVKANLGERITLKVERSDTVKRVKAMIYAEEDIPADQQRLFYAGQELEDHHTLEYYEIEEYMQFRVVVRFRPQTVQILVKNLTGNKFTLDVNKFDSVVQVKAMIEEKEGISVDQQRLIYGGKLLEDDHILDYYEIEDDSIIHLVLSMTDY